MSKTINDNSNNWETKLKVTAFKYHVLIAWVAILLNPIWAIADYYTIRAHAIGFFIFRIVVSFIILFVIIFKKKLLKYPEIIAFVPFIGISIQNAYMCSVMNASELQSQTFAYIALFIGAGMFVLWRPLYSVAVVIVSFIANIFFFGMNSHLALGDILINGGLLTVSVAFFTIILINMRTNLTKKEIIARLALAESNKKLAVQNEIIEEKNKDIRDSINYAERIQNAILPPLKKIDTVLKDYFILYKPKDIVSGDFYWQASVNTTPNDNTPSQHVVVLAAVDCTGHGVPGALMSIIGSTILNQTINNIAINTPADALGFLNTEISKTLNSIRDGMDISLCAINFKKMELQYAGANNPLYIVRNNNFIEIKADKKTIGADSDGSEIKTFTNHIIPLEKDDAIYMFTDGYADQFGGPQGKKFKYKKFQDLFIKIQNNSMQKQKDLLNYHHEQWRGKLEQVDDILIIGIKV